MLGIHRGLSLCTLLEAMARNVRFPKMTLISNSHAKVPSWKELLEVAHQ